MNKIDSLVKDKSDSLELLNALKKKLRDMRSAGVSKGGEYSLENLVFKELRNKGYLDKLSKYILKIEDESMSINIKRKKK